jgi:hypothetical protein
VKSNAVQIKGSEKKHTQTFLVLLSSSRVRGDNRNARLKKGVATVIVTLRYRAGSRVVGMSGTGLACSPA